MADGQVGGYSTETVVKVFALATLLLLISFNPVLGIIAAAAVYKYGGDYFGGSGSEDTDPNPPWGDADPVSSGGGSDIEGPEGEVLTRIPDGMGSFEAEYDVYVTSTAPVTVELERSTDGSAGRILRKVASYLGYADSPRIRRLYAEPPRAVREEAVWRITRDLDTSLDTEKVPDGRFRCGTCTVEAADAFDGFRYSVRYPTEYVRA